MTALNAEMRFWRVKIKPGKPLAFGVARGRPLLGLPGNPVSSFVAFYQFVRPVLHRLAGGAGDGRLERLPARLTAPVKSPPGRQDYQRGRLALGPQGWQFTPFPDQGSGNLTSLVGTSGLAVIPEGVGALPAGATVTVERLPTGPVDALGPGGAPAAHEDRQD
jgi:molybdopterin molybdotransferase